MMKNLVNAMATAIVAATAEQMGPKAHLVSRRNDGTKFKVYHMAEVAHSMSKKQFHDTVLSAFMAFKKRNTFVEIETLGDKEINNMYDDLISRDDNCTTIGYSVSHWEWEYDGINYTGCLQASFVPANGGIVCRFEFSLHDPFKDEWNEFRHWTEMANAIYKLHERLQEVKDWLHLHEVKKEAPIPKTVSMSELEKEWDEK